MSINLQNYYNNINRLNKTKKKYISPKRIKNFPYQNKKKPKIIVIEKANICKKFPSFIELSNYISKTPDRNLYKDPNSRVYIDNKAYYLPNNDIRLKERLNHSSDYITITPYGSYYGKTYDIRNLNYPFDSPELTDSSVRMKKIITNSPNNYPRTDLRDYNKKNEIKVEIGEDYIPSEKNKMKYLFYQNSKRGKKNRKIKSSSMSPVNNIKVINKNNYYKMVNNENLNRRIPLKFINKSVDRYTNRYIDNNIPYMTGTNDYRNIYNISPSEQTYSNINEDIQSNINIINNNSFNIYNDNIKIRLYDLAYLEEIFDNIIYIINNKNILYINTTNECIDFFDFYFNSSLKDKFAFFFADQNYVIIQTAFNLMLFMLIIIFHLSINPPLLMKYIFLVRNIFDKLKINLYLFVKRMQLYYGDAFCCKKEEYFNKFNNFLILNGFFDLNEREIVDIISFNSVFSCNQLKELLNYYRKINNEYYYDFYNIFYSLSKLSEEEIRDFFYNNLLNIPNEDINNNINYAFDNYKYNIKSNNIIKNYIEEEDFIENGNRYLNDAILNYKINKQIPPFVKPITNKKYTIVLDIGGTLLNVKLLQNGDAFCRWRPGILSFLTGIKPYYEIIAFSKLSKEYSELIINQIDRNRILFDYNLCREHCVLVNDRFIKDISRIGRDMKKMIMVDDLPENLEYHIDNGILILPYDADNEYEDRVLFELKKLLLLFYKMGFEDIRQALKKYQNEIYNKITMGNIDL